MGREVVHSVLDEIGFFVLSFFVCVRETVTAERVSGGWCDLCASGNNACSLHPPLLPLHPRPPPPLPV